MKSIVLVGPRCVGKTTVGDMLSDKLNLTFVDADKVFERNYGSISEFVKKNGWQEFRRMESRTLEGITNLYSGRTIVLSPGGGAVAHNQCEEYRSQNVNVLRNFGNLFYLIPSSNLEESAIILAERLQNDSNSASLRPALTQESDAYKEMLQILQNRHPLYSAAAHQTLLVGKKSPEEITSNILSLI